MRTPHIENRVIRNGLLVSPAPRSAPEKDHRQHLRHLDQGQDAQQLSAQLDDGRVRGED